MTAMSKSLEKLSTANKQYIEERLNMISILGDSENSFFIQNLLDTTETTEEKQPEVRILMERYKEVLKEIHPKQDLNNEMINLSICLSCLEDCTGLERLAIMHKFGFKSEINRHLIDIKEDLDLGIKNFAKLTLSVIERDLSMTTKFGRLDGSNNLLQLGQLKLSIDKGEGYPFTTRSKRIIIRREEKEYASDNLYLGRDFLAILVDSDKYLIIRLYEDKEFIRTEKYLKKHPTLHIAV